MTGHTHSYPGNSELRHFARRTVTGNIEIVDRQFDFVRALLPYDYAFTCNAQQWDEAERICEALEGPMISQGIVTVAQAAEVTDEFSFAHEGYCNASRKIRVGGDGCSCRAGREIKRLRAGLTEISELGDVRCDEAPLIARRALSLSSTSGGTAA